MKVATVMGVPRVLNGFRPLMRAISEDTTSVSELIRKDGDNLEFYRARGTAFMEEYLGVEDTRLLIATMTKHWPDMGKWYNSRDVPSMTNIHRTNNFQKK